MKQLLQFLLVSIVFLSFSSCEKEGLTHQERLLIGEWTYSKVKFTPEWSVDVADVTDEFESFQLELKPDFTVSYTDVSTGLEYTGIWETVRSTGQETVSTAIFISLSNSATDELKQLVFDNISVTRNKLRAIYNGEDGRFRYVLDK